MATFEELGIAPDILRALDEMGYEEPSPVQVQAIPPQLAGKDVIVQALTGTGKTAAFGVPIVQSVDQKRVVPQAVVLVPTRELAIQVSEEISNIARHRPIWVLPIYGGQPIQRQLSALRRGVHVVVATPGRLMDHMERKTVKLDAVQTLILDEADQMLEMGFHEDVAFIMEHLPADRQTALFSATIPAPIQELAQRYMREPETIRLSRPRQMTVPQTEQTYYLVPFPRKTDGLVRVLDVRTPERTLVFCSTKRMVDQLTEDMRGRGFRAAALHGDMSQAAREATLGEFRRGLLDILIATDVAARGLDIPDVALVVNYDIPQDAEAYTHRIGRTGRMGRPGEAITFVNPREMGEMRVIERFTGARIRRGELPTTAEVAEREREILQEELARTLRNGQWGQFREVVEELADEHDLVDIAAAAVAMVAKRSRRPSARARAGAEEEVRGRQEERGERSQEPGDGRPEIEGRRPEPRPRRPESREPGRPFGRPRPRRR
jgi:ATP-dependent RNA helicase DeaD